MIISILVSLLFLVYSFTALECDETYHLQSGAKRRYPSLIIKHQRERRLRVRQLAADECWNIPGSNITQQTLGPSYDNDSLYNNVLFESAITGVDNGSTQILPINILANLLVEEILLYSDTYKFVQENEYFGRYGEYTEEMLSQHQLLIDFWQLTNDPPILLIGLHSEILQPEGNLEMAVAVLSYLNRYQDDIVITDKVQLVAAQARFAIETELPNGYSNNDLTYDDGYFFPNFGVIGYEDSSAIVAGDGALYFDVQLGNVAVGSDIFHAHEFGHALQYILDLEDVNGDVDVYLDNYVNHISPESSRYSELEADAMAAYALAHKQGRNFPLSLLFEATKSAFAIGDCAYDSDEHHGTPKQRECATKWGADEGLDMIGTPLTPREFRILFRQSYEKILALDSTACQLTDDIGDSSNNITTSPASSPVTINATNAFHPMFPNISELFPSSSEATNLHDTIGGIRLLSTWTSLTLLLYAFGWH
jgi:hypothetical protein